MNKKILIICDDFPPLNSVGALRPYSWFKEFRKHSIDPVVVTRNWPKNIHDLREKFYSEATERKVEESAFGTVIRAGHTPDSRDCLIANHGFEKFNLIRKLLTLRNQLFGPCINRYDAYHFIYREALSYIGSNQVDLMVVTGSPFGLFMEAHRLGNKTGVPWLADYRDPFTGNKSASQGGLSALLVKLNERREKKWTSNCIGFTTVSPAWVASISKVISRKGQVIYNGFDSDLLPSEHNDHPSLFTVTYLGTIYDAAYIQLFENAFRRFIQSAEIHPDDIRFQFVGTTLNRTAGTNKMLKLASSFPEQIRFLPACSNEDALKIAATSAVLLNLNYSNASQGVIPAKLLEYLALKKPIISVENRDTHYVGEFDNYLSVVLTEEELFNNLMNFYLQWKRGESMKTAIPDNLIQSYSRSEQAKKMAEHIHQLI